MNKRATKRLKEIVLANRVMPLKQLPEGLKTDWRKIKQMYQEMPRNNRHNTLWKSIKDE